MPKISFEGMAGLLMEIIVIILEQVHVTAAYIIWPLFIFGAYLIGDAIWRGEWKKKHEKWAAVKRAFICGVASLVFLSAIAMWLLYRIRNLDKHPEAVPVAKVIEPIQPSVQKPQMSRAAPHKTLKRPRKKVTAPQPTFSVNNPVGSIVNQGSPNYGTQTVNNAPPDRTLDKSQYQTIKESLGPPVNGFQGVHRLFGDIEGAKYAHQLSEAFKAANWDVGANGQEGLTSVPEGLFVVMSPDDRQSPPLGALRVIAALKQAGLHAQGFVMDDVKSGD
ncbi:MAG: hypothetical protein ACHQJX_00450 [Candidatus Acidiferrales bacterium]